MSFLENWPELISVVLVFVGGLLAVSTSNYKVLIITLLVAGGLFGHLWWLYRKTARWPLILMTGAFLLGFMLGSDTSIYQTVIVTFFIGYCAVLLLHKNGLV